jgi:DNA-binding transcriptional ArsR family regulator
VSDEKRQGRDRLEVSSQPLQDELVAIKDRLSAIETIQSISNEAVVKRYVEERIKTEFSKKIMGACEDARTKEDLVAALKYNSKQALDYHLQPLKEADLLEREVREDGTVVFKWSNLFRRLPKATIRSILGEQGKRREPK